MRTAARWGFVSIAFVTAGLGMSEAFGADGDRINRLLYEATLKCVIVNIAAEGERRDAGDTEGAANYAAKAEAAYDTAYGLGDWLRLSSARIESDLNAVQERELARMVGDMDYLLEAAANCKALGLM